VNNSSSNNKKENSIEFEINTANEGFWNYDLINYVFTLSPGWKEYLGFKAQEKITYIDYMNLIAEEDRFDHHHAIHGAIEDYDGEVEFVHFKIKYTLYTKSEEKLSIEDFGDIFFDEDNKPIRINGFHRNINK